MIFTKNIEENTLTSTLTTVWYNMAECTKPC